MKKKINPIVFAIVCATLSFQMLSCTKEVRSSSANAETVNADKATTFTDNEKEPVDAIVTVSCANGGSGENVHLTGTLHVLIHTTVNGNDFVTKYHFQPQGVKGIGLTTGTIYNANGASQETVSGAFNNGKYSRTDINNFRIIGQGPGNNYLVHDNSHLTINANGKTTVSTDNFSVDCK